MISPQTPSQRILVALDTPDVEKARSLSLALAGHVGGVKLGLEFFNANGPDGVRRVVQGELAETPRGEPVTRQPFFLDLKYHDIPNTVAGAVRSAMPMGPMILNVHASGNGVWNIVVLQIKEEWLTRYRFTAWRFAQFALHHPAHALRSVRIEKFKAQLDPADMAGQRQ